MGNADGTPEKNQIDQLSSRSKRPSGLGRGLSALLGDIQTEAAIAGPAPVAGGSSGSANGLTLLPLTEVFPHPDQPRRHFDEAALAELADSIRLRGLVQPILVRAAPQGRGWQIVAGERRWRAAQRAGLHQIPAVVRDLSDADTFTIALIENIQRKDLTAVEEAEAYARLRDQLGHSAEAIGSMTGKSRSHVTNLLRLLELPSEVRELVGSGQLGMGHARALIGHPDAVALARKAVRSGYSVRKVEALVRAGRGRGQTDSAGPRRVDRDADIAALESHLAALLGVSVRIDHGADMRGSLTLSYSDLEQLDMLCQRLSGEKF